MPNHSYRMQSLAHALPRLPIPGFDPAPTRSRFKVWRGSTTKDVPFKAPPKEEARLWFQKAREWDRKTKVRGRHGGGIGMPALQVLQALQFDFINWTTGRLDPGYRAIMKRTGLAKSTVAKALAKLKALGIIWWERRSAHAFDENGMFVLKQITNAYALLPPSQWPGYVDLVLEEAVNRAPWPEACGATPPMPDLLSQAMTAVADGASVGRLVSLLAAEPDNELAQALARFGRSLGADKA